MAQILLLALLASCAFCMADSQSIVYNISAVAVYYESLCPYSRAFITGSLNDAYLTVPELISVIDMIPYGIENETLNANGTYSYTCQHGPNECVGNQEECCIINIYRDYNIYFPIIECMEAADEPWNATDQCSNGYNMTPVHQCYNDGQGAKLEHLAGLNQDALNPPLQFVPWIVINGTHTDSMQNSAENNLTRYLCDLQWVNCPAGCFTLSPRPGCHPQSS